MAIFFSRFVSECNGYVVGSNELEKLQQSLAYVKSFTRLLADEFTVMPQIAEVIISDYDAFNGWLLPYRPGKHIRKKNFSIQNISHAEKFFFFFSLYFVIFFVHIF